MGGFHCCSSRSTVPRRAQGARPVSNIRGKNKIFSDENLLDRNPDTYWSTDDSITSPEIELILSKPATFNVVSLREYLPLGQRVDTWALDRWENNKWIEFVSDYKFNFLILYSKHRNIFMNKCRCVLFTPHAGNLIFDFLFKDGD